MTRRLGVRQDSTAWTPIFIPVEIKILDLRAEPGARWVDTVAKGHQAWAWVLEGAVEADGQSVAACQALRLSPSMTCTAPSAGARLVVFSGRPTSTTVVQAGPFVGSSRAEIEAFHARYRSGGMGRLPAFDQDAIGRAFDAAQKNIA
jgi:redox-sensitive bicupin YhaK (pirin superfamily)